MEGMGLPKSFMSVILGKHQSSIYREFNRNGSGGVYTGAEAQAASDKVSSGENNAGQTGGHAEQGGCPRAPWDTG
jgi:IS30 family transposase